jgi:hypothetical protein
LYFSQGIVRVIKSRRLRWIGGRSTYGKDEKRIILGGKLEGKKSLKETYA